MNFEYDIYCKDFEDLGLCELYDIMALRSEVFVVEQNCPYLDPDGKDKYCDHLMIYDVNEEKLVTYARIVPPGKSYRGYASIGRVVNSMKYRNTGLGKLLMANAIRLTKEYYPDKKIKISAQTYLSDFYQSFGFKKTGKEYLEDNIPHIAMVLD